MDNLGETIRNLREQNELPLRKVAAYLDIDQAVLSKYEHGTRMPKREQIIQLARFFKVDKKDLLVNWLAEKIIAELSDDELAAEALHLAGERMKSKPGKFKKELAAKFDVLKLGESAKMENSGIAGKLPSFAEFARYLFNTATGEKFDEKAVDLQTGFIGESHTHDVYLFYKPNLEWLKNNALTLNMVKELPVYKGKRRLIFATLKYVNDETLKTHHIDFCPIPYELYR